MLIRSRKVSGSIEQFQVFMWTLAQDTHFLNFPLVVIVSLGAVS